jgi:hypothetical protein
MNSSKVTLRLNWGWFQPDMAEFSYTLYTNNCHIFIMVGVKRGVEFTWGSTAHQMRHLSGSSHTLPGPHGQRCSTMTAPN